GGRIRDGDNVDRRVGRAVDVGAVGPTRRVNRQLRVRRVKVANLEQRPSESLRGVGDSGHVGEARTRHAGADRGGVTTGRALLQVAPQVGLHLHDHGLAVRACLLHQQLEVRVVGGHGARVVEVAVVAVRRVGARGRVRLQELVVAEDGEVSDGAGRVHVRGGESAGRAVPDLPALVRVDAGGKVLIAV